MGNEIVSNGVVFIKQQPLMPVPKEEDSVPHFIDSKAVNFLFK